MADTSQLKIEIRGKCLEIYFYIHGLMNYNCELTILFMIEVFKIVNNWGEKSCDWLLCVCEENSRVNALHKQPISFRWFISSQSSKAEMEFSVTAYE